MSERVSKPLVTYPRPLTSAISRLSLCFLLSACDGAAAGDAPIPILAAEPGRRLGHFDDPNLGFSRVIGVDVDADGNLFVGEASVPEIRVIGLDGSIVRRIGRRGAGPGEFDGPPRFGLVGDTLWTIEPSSQRLTLFDLEGTVMSTGLAESVTIELPGIWGYLRPVAMRPDGKFISHLGSIGNRRGDPPTTVTADDSLPVPFVLYDPNGEVTDTIGWTGRPPPQMWRRPSEEGQEFKTMQVGERRIVVPTPRSDLPRWLPVLDGYVEVETPLAQSAEGGEIIVRRIGVAGDTVYATAIPYVPDRYAPEELDALAESAARGLGGGVFAFPDGTPTPEPPDGWEDAVAPIRAAMSFPEFKLPIEYSWVAQDESVWIRRSGPDESIGKWLILEADGTIRGELTLPGNASPNWNRGNTLWAVVPDEFDVQWLVEYRVGA